MIDALRVGRRAKQVGKHRGYFADNRARMQYPSFEAAKVPLGSGALESAIRRVINMRMKGNGSFWQEPSAEAMLLLRSDLKAGRFDQLVDGSIATAAPWWRALAIPDLLASPITPTGWWISRAPNRHRARASRSRSHPLRVRVHDARWLRR
jgi:hypothetical protein